MKELMTNLFGIYQPIQYVTSSGDTIIPSGFAGVDWTYVCGVALFALWLYFVSRIIGGVFSAIFRH